MKPKVCYLLFAYSALALSACARSEQGAFTGGSGGVNSYSHAVFQTKTFFVNPPINLKMGDEIGNAAHKSCAQFTNFVWVPNMSTPPSQVKTLPGELEEKNQTTDKSSRLKRRSRVSKNEFSLTPEDISMYENNPQPLDVLESLNIFSSDILPKHVDGKRQTCD